MTTVKAEYVEQVMRDHGTQYWIIRDDSGKNILNRNESDIGIDESINKFRAALANVSGTVSVTVRSRNNKDIQSAGDKFTGVFDFKVKSGNSGAGSFMGSADFSLMGLMQENTKLQLEMQKRELESKYGSGKDSALDTALASLLQDNTVKSVISGLANKFLGIAPAPVQIAAADPDKLSDVEQAAALFAKIDPEAPAILLKLAKHVQETPAMWWGFKSTLQEQKIV